MPNSAEAPTIQPQPEQEIELTEADLEELPALPPEDEVELTESDLEEIKAEETAQLAKARKKIEADPFAIANIKQSRVRVEYGGMFRKKESQLEITTSEMTAKGKHEYNEDHMIMDAEKGLLILCDGVGSGGDGHIASKTATEATYRQLKSLSYTEKSEAVEKALKQAIIESAKKVKQGYTTLSVAKLLLDKKTGAQKLVIAHIGDSPIYRFTKSGELQKLTRDHTELSLLVDSILDNNEHLYTTLKDIIKQGKGYLKDLKVTDEEFEALFARVKAGVQQNPGFIESEYFKMFESTKPLTRQDQLLFGLYREVNRRSSAINQRMLSDVMQLAQARTIDLDAGDLIITCSDGVSDNLTQAQISAIIAQHGIEASQFLVQSAVNEATTAHEQQSVAAKKKQIAFVRAKGYDDTSAQVMQVKQAA